MINIYALINIYTATTNYLAEIELNMSRHTSK